jgi:hypothetical protein
MITRSITAVILIAAFVLSACASATPTVDTMMEKPTEIVSESHDEVQGVVDEPMEKPTEEMVEPTAEEMMDDDKSDMEPTSEPTEEREEVMFPDWFSASLVNVNTQVRFKIEDFKGKVILVETLAMWCSTCRRQQNEVVILHEKLGDRDDFISIALDIDPNEVADDLKTYTQNNGFDWTYAISPPAVSNEIAELYGNQFLNPPSAPMFIIDREGTVHPLRFGVKSADELLETLQPFLDATM